MGDFSWSRPGTGHINSIILNGQLYFGKIYIWEYIIIIYIIYIYGKCGLLLYPKAVRDGFVKQIGGFCHKGWGLAPRKACLGL